VRKERRSLGAPRPAAAQPTPAGAPFPISSADVGVTPSPEVAGNDRGEVAVLWLGECPEFGLCMRSYDAAGAPLIAQRALDIGGELLDRVPAAALSATGVLWTAWDQPGTGGVGSEIVVRRYALDGSPLGGTQVVATGDFSSGVDKPDVAVMPGGGAVVVWYRLGVEQIGEAIQGRLLGPSAQPSGPVFRVDSAASADYVSDPSVAAAASGRFAVAWESYEPDPDEDDVLARVFDAAAQPLGGEFRVHLGSSGIQDEPRAAATPGGSFLIAWENRSIAGTGPGIYARAVAAGGPLGGGETRLHTTTSGQHVEPAAAGGGNGFAVAWAVGETGRTRVFLRTFNSNGVPQGGEQEVAPAFGLHDRRPGVAADGAGNLFVAWNRRDQQFRRQIYGRRYLAPPPGVCADLPTVLCLGPGGRFQVEVAWHDQHNGNDGVGTAIDGTEKTGYFWFFNSANVELVTKVLDGRPITGHWWFFYGALSDVEYTITVTDTQTGERRFYDNAPGEICGRGDTSAFPLPGPSSSAPATGPVRPAAGRALRAIPLGPPAVAADAGGASPVTAAEGTCTPDDQHLCLLGGRFRVNVSWHDQHNDNDGVGHAIPFAEKTGFFWFFNSANVELVVKALDGRPVNGHWWFFYGALSDVEYTITVVDTTTGTPVTYHNAPGEICGRGDTTAF
jgi:hypothetical protein